MSNELLKNRLKEICNQDSTVLWLEGSQTLTVRSFKFNKKRLILNFDNGTARVLLVERYAFTRVGIQVWSQGRPGVIYVWDAVPKDQGEGGREAPPKTNLSRESTLKSS